MKENFIEVINDVPSMATPPSLLITRNKVVFYAAKRALFIFRSSPCLLRTLLNYEAKDLYISEEQFS